MRGATIYGSHLCLVLFSFQSTLPLRGATGQAYILPYGNKFQSTLPLRGATRNGRGCIRFLFYFNPHSPCGERRPGERPDGRRREFQSTLPLRGATRHLQLGRERRQISIHTPLAGSDTPPCVLSAAVIDFNPHSPCGERPRTMRRSSPCHSYFNPHSPCGERLEFCELVGSEVEISIHTPLAGSDAVGRIVPEVRAISIHTPLAGSDRHATASRTTGRHFNPHSPCGERLGPVLRCGEHDFYFNPHSPCGERPTPRGCNWETKYFNPHSPCGERRTDPLRSVWPKLFQSTLPLRGATGLVQEHGRHVRISIHTPLAGSDPVSADALALTMIFQSTLPLRGATWTAAASACRSEFQSTLPLRGATWVKTRTADMP